MFRAGGLSRKTRVSCSPSAEMRLVLELLAATSTRSGKHCMPKLESNPGHRYWTVADSPGHSRSCHWCQSFAPTLLVKRKTITLNEDCDRLLLHST
jgi:hypothetical protein